MAVCAHGVSSLSAARIGHSSSVPWPGQAATSCERSVHALQFGHAVRDVLQPGLCRVAHAAHVVRVAVAERQQVGDFFQGESQRRGAADEAQPAQVLLGEDAVAPAERAAVGSNCWRS